MTPRLRLAVTTHTHEITFITVTGYVILPHNAVYGYSSSNGNTLHNSIVGGKCDIVISGYVCFESDGGAVNSILKWVIVVIRGSRSSKCGGLAVVRSFVRSFVL